MCNMVAEVAQLFGRLVPRLIKLYPLTNTESLLQSPVSCSPEQPNDRATVLIMLLENKLFTLFYKYPISFECWKDPWS